MTLPTRSDRRSFLTSLGTVAAGIAVAGCEQTTRTTEPDGSTTQAAAEFDEVVDPAWLADNREAVALLDIREASAFRDGHIPGAARLPDTELLEDHYTETTDGYEAAPEVVASVLGERGVSPTDDVVVYGEGSTLWETYAIYTLKAIGHEGTVSLLDGGYSLWTAADGEVATGSIDPSSVSYDPAMNFDVIATRARVSDAVDGALGDVQLVDNRSPSEYYGTDDGTTRRQGHIPDAINIQFTQNLADDRLRPPAELRRLWIEGAGLDPETETISYCSTGVRGSVGWFVMRQLGWETVRNYEGSWADWGTLAEGEGYPSVSGEGTGTVVDIFE